jgi:hypothetical protein
MGKREVHYGNYEIHHKQRQFMVFYFYAKDHADYFEALLIEAEIPYERGSGKDMLRRHLFGVHQSHLNQANALNNQTGHFFRKPFLGDNLTRYVVLIATLAVLCIALIGWWKSQA